MVCDLVDMPVCIKLKYYDHVCAGQDLCRQLQVEGAAKERGEVNCVLSRSQSS